VQLLFESGYYSRVAFIKMKKSTEGGVAADTRESTPRDTATLATVMDTELEESDPFVDGLEEN